MYIQLLNDKLLFWWSFTKIWGGDLIIIVDNDTPTTPNSIMLYTVYSTTPTTCHNVSSDAKYYSFLYQ